MIKWMVAGLALAVAPMARGDGAFFSAVADRLAGPEQKAIVCWDGARETLLIASQARGQRMEDVMQAAWVIPLPEKPKVGPGAPGAFVKVVSYFEERSTWTDQDESQVGVPGGALRPGVALVDRMAIGIFDVSVLDATDADALVTWLSKNGYRVPAPAKQVIADCIAGGTRYFVANRINLTGKGTDEAKRALALIDQSRPASTSLEDLRREVIAAVLAGTPFDQSPCASGAGQVLKFLDRSKYDALLAQCKVGPEAVSKLELFSDHWQDFLMGDRQPGEALRVYPDDLEILVTVGHGLSAWGKRLEVGVPQYALDRAGAKLDDVRAFMKKSFLDIAKKYAQVRGGLDLTLMQRCLSVNQDLERFRDGLATPLKLEFAAKQAMYPLRISSINPGDTRVDVYVCAATAVEDASGTLKATATRPLPGRLAAALKAELDVGAATVLTRLEYSGPAGALAKDATFAASKTAVTRPELDEPAFEAPFRAVRSQDPRDAALELLKDLLAYAEQHPQSKYADDAVVLALDRVGWLNQPEKAILDRLRERLRAVPKAGLHLEPWTLLEQPELNRAEYFRAKDLLKELLVADLAKGYRAAGEGKLASELATKLLASLDKRPADDPAVAGLRRNVEHLKEAPALDAQSDALTAAATALLARDAAKAVALVEPLTRKPAPAGAGAGMFANLHPMTPWFILGNAEMSRDRVEPARVAFEKAIELGADLHMGMLMVGERIMHVNQHLAQVHLCGCYLRLDRVDDALKVGEAALAGLAEHTPGDTRSIAMGHYNLACAYGRKSDAAKAVANLKEAIEREKRYKSAAAKDTDFKAITGDAAFQALLK